MSFLGVGPWVESRFHWKRYEFTGLLPELRHKYIFAIVSKILSIDNQHRMYIAQDIYSDRRPFLMLDITRSASSVEEAKRKTDEIILQKYGDIILSQERISKLELLL